MKQVKIISAMSEKSFEKKINEFIEEIDDRFIGIELGEAFLAAIVYEADKRR